jgi:hypothetical protein
MKFLPFLMVFIIISYITCLLLDNQYKNINSSKDVEFVVDTLLNNKSEAVIKQGPIEIVIKNSSRFSINDTLLLIRKCDYMY